jgi:hypothetical protein
MTIPELEKLLKAAQDYTDEFRRLDLMEADAKKAIKEAGKVGDLQNSAVQRKVGNADIQLRLVALRREEIEIERSRSLQALFDAARLETERWNRLVIQDMAATEEARIQSSLPFWEGDARACRHYHEERMAEVPALHKFT